MKTIQTKTSILTALKSFTAKSLRVIVITLFVSATYSNMYANDNNVSNTNFLENINLKGISENQLDFLQWEVSQSSPVAYFTVEYAKSSNMIFTELTSINPVECAESSRKSCFSFRCNTGDDQDVVYYRVRATFADNHVLESNIIGVSKSETAATMNISSIKNQDGRIVLSFKSPKAQNITLNILDRTGQLIVAKDIFALEGDNTYSYDAGSMNATEMLIFSLNNNQEQITKKYMLASAW